MTVNFSDKKEVDKVATQIILKYCRKYKSGRPILCRPSHEEEVERNTNRKKEIKRKYIYDSEEIALACAKELRIVVGFRPQRAYLCYRTKHGHHHLTSRKD